MGGAKNEEEEEEKHTKDINGIVSPQQTRI